jgi:hypothetical protein
MMNRVVAVIAGVVGFWFLLLASPRELVWSLRWLVPDVGLPFLLTGPGSFPNALVAFAFAVILLLFAYKRFHASPKKTAEYVKQEEGAWLRLDVSPVAAPVNWFVTVLAVGMGASIVGSGLSYIWVMGLLCAVGTGLVLLPDPRGTHASRHGKFRVGSEGIEIDKQLLRKADIHHVRIKNKFGEDVEIVYDASRGMPTGVVAGLTHRRKLAEVAYQVEVEAGGKAHVLAAGLDEVTARGVATEIGKALNLGASAS